MRTNPGFTLVEIMIVVAIIGLLAAIAIPNYVKSRNSAQEKACVNNLRLIDGGKDQGALANKWTDGTDPTQMTSLVNGYLKGSTTPECPAGGTYGYNNVGTNPTCTITSPITHKMPVD